MAVPNSRTITLPGRNSLTIPIVGTNKNNELSGISKSTPEWMISIDTIFELGNFYEGDSTLIELFGFTYGTERETTGHSVNQLLSSSATRFSDLIVIIQNGAYSPVLEQRMNDGTCIQTIKIKRFGWINATLQVLEERIFQICYITHFKQILDYVVLHIRTCNRTETIKIYNQEGGSDGGSGNIVSAIDGSAIINKD